jgi:GT2 family glycosyltransferase
VKIAVVILNWNGKQLLEKFLPSVVKYSTEADVYVADNASSDDSVSFVKKRFPNVSIIQNKVNGGYAKGYNDSLKHVEADIFCLLNNDVEVTENWLLPIKQEFSQNESTAIIQPKILDFKNKAYFEYAGAAGGFIDKYGYPYCRGRIFNHIERDIGQYNDACNIFWASGACLLIRKSVFVKLQGFDESFFAHMEEIDLCWRARNKGFSTKYVGTSTIYHLGGATLPNSNPEKTYLNFRNSLYAITKNASGNLFVLIFFRLILDGIAGIRFVLQLKFSHMFAIARAHFSFYNNLSNLLNFRKVNKSLGKYAHKNSIIWLYFIKNRNTFERL